MKRFVCLLSFLAVMSMLPITYAQDVAASDPGQTMAPAPEAEAAEALGLNIGLEISSIYNFRGANVFGGGEQNKQHAMFAPSFTWSIGDSGFSLGWWSGYQLSGSNQAEGVDTGLGHEQDIVIGYSHGFYDDALTISASLSAFLYPFASGNDADDANRPGAGTGCPAYIEPLFGIGYSGPIDLGLNLSYFAGLQSAVEDYRYLYLNPSIGKTFSLHQQLDLSVAFSYGYKVFNDMDKMTDNVQDIRFDYELTWKVLDAFAITPNLHTGWSNFDSLSIGKEYMIYGGVRLGYDF